MSVKTWDIFGGFKYFCSLICLRYTPLNYYFLRRFFAAHPAQRLHLGCGLCLLPGWCNIAYEWNKEYGRQKRIKGQWWFNYDLRQPWPWLENSVDFIAAAHFIEHFKLDEGIEICHKAFKVLKPGGVIRLSCPDLETYARHYVQNNGQFYNDEEIRKACPFSSAETFSQVFAAKAYEKEGEHKWFHDFSSLKSMLEKVGFVNICRVGRTEGKTPDLERLELPHREIETVYVQAQKP